MMAKITWQISVVCLLVAAIQACERGSSKTFVVNYPKSSRGKNVWTVGVPTVELSANITCDKEYYYYYYYHYYYYNMYLINASHAQTANLGYLAMAYYGSTYCDTQKPLLSSSYCHGFSSDTTILKLVFNALEVNSTYFQIDFYDGKNYTTSPFILEYCAVPDYLEADERPNRSYTYQEEANVTCSKPEEHIFTNKTTYASSLPIRCGKHADWENVTAECDIACNTPDKLEVLSSAGTQPKYRRGTEVEFVCTTGRMYRPDSPKFIRKSTETCQEKGSWKYVYDCWTGQVVEFAEENQDLISGRPTIFTCEANSYYDTVVVTIGNNRTEPKRSIWRNITIDKDFHGLKVRCDEIHSAGNVIATKETTLNVKYSPVLTKPDVVLFSLESGTSGHIVIEFQTNPVIDTKNIRISKNGTEIKNFYLLVDGHNHQVVVDFTQVTPETYGDYAIFVTSRPPVETTVKYNFTIKEKIKVQAGSSATAEAVGISVGVGLGVVIAGGLLGYLLLRRLRDAGEKNKREERPVEFHAKQEDNVDMHDYEDMDAPTQRYGGPPMPGNEYRLAGPVPPPPLNEEIYENAEPTNSRR